MPARPDARRSPRPAQAGAVSPCPIALPNRHSPQPTRRGELLSCEQIIPKRIRNNVRICRGIIRQPSILRHRDLADIPGKYRHRIEKIWSHSLRGSYPLAEQGGHRVAANSWSPGPRRSEDRNFVHYVAMGHGRGFLRLHKKFARSTWLIVVLFLGWYGCYIGMSAFARNVMEIRVLGNINLGLVLGVLQFASTFLLAWARARYSRIALDPLADRLRAEINGYPQAILPPAPQPPATSQDRATPSTQASPPPPRPEAPPNSPEWPVTPTPAAPPIPPTAQIPPQSPAPTAPSPTPHRFPASPAPQAPDPRMTHTSPAPPMQLGSPLPPARPEPNGSPAEHTLPGARGTALPPESVHWRTPEAHSPTPRSQAPAPNSWLSPGPQEAPTHPALLLPPAGPASTAAPVPPEFAQRRMSPAQGSQAMPGLSSSPAMPATEPQPSPWSPGSPVPPAPTANRGGAWNGPVGLGPEGVLPPGAALAASPQYGVDGQTDVSSPGQYGPSNLPGSLGSPGLHAPMQPSRSRASAAAADPGPLEAPMGPEANTSPGDPSPPGAKGTTVRPDASPRDPGAPKATRTTVRPESGQGVSQAQAAGPGAQGAPGLKSEGGSWVSQPPHWPMPPGVEGARRGPAAGGGSEPDRRRRLGDQS